LTLSFTKTLALGAVLMTVNVPRSAFAEAPRVLLVRPAGAAREVKIALVRVQGELTADGFQVVPIEAEPGASSASSLSQAESADGATAVGLFLNAEGTSAELWVVDKLTDKTVVRHLTTAGQSENALPEVLAVRVVELLRASLLELMVERKRVAVHSAPRGAERARQWAVLRLEARGARPRWAVEAGIAAIWSPGQVEAAVESVVRGRFAVMDSWHVRASFIGLGTHPEVSGVGGRAAIEQWNGLVETLFSPLNGAALQPTCSLGLGVFHTSVSGAASWPYQGLRDSQWALAADAGLGFAWRFASRLELSIEGHGLWTTPEPIVRFVTADGARIAHPALVGSLSLTGWL
jgi:hypothetical protein